MNTSTWERASAGYSTVETLLEEVSNHMAASNISRHSRGSIGSKTGVSMRISKPNSANNSPRNSFGLSRRMTDGAYRRRLAMLEQEAQEHTGFVSNNGLQPQTVSTRPVSWHPVTQIPQTTYPVPYPQQFPQTNIPLAIHDFQPSPATHSGYNSPALSFSPITGPLQAYEQQQYIAQNRHSYHSSSYLPQQIMHAVPSQPLPPTTLDNGDPSMYSHFDWGNFAVNGFEESSTTPPTPENFLPIQHPEPTFPEDDAIPYHPLDDSEDGEELVGMGLYDTPEAKSPPSDPHLENYRALMMSQLMGTPYRRPEPTGKGLKLEESWNPPSSDGEEDSDQDGDAEEEEEGAAPVAAKVHSDDHSHTVIDNLIHSDGVQTYTEHGWL